MKSKFILPSLVLAIGGIALLIGTTSKAKAKPEVQKPAQSQIQRGEYLVKFGDCAACHTPLKFGPNGPEPDLALFLAGHPEKPNCRRPI